ncbi:MAG: virulence RhuM family protein [Clostridia bacterium]
MKDTQILDNTFKEMILYKTEDGDVKLDVYLMNENLWLTQIKISELFNVDRTVITKHLKNIFDQKELNKDSVCANIAHTANDKKIYKTCVYNLDAIIAIGYRINSSEAVNFRTWASKILKEYIIKGFAMNDDRLKDPNYLFGKDYFEEQLERIRDIRSSERRFYQKITDIYSKCSSDYDFNSDITKTFFATVQNKLHFAITGRTAAEIINDRANSKSENMGLTSWKNSPNGKIRKQDVSIAKNYLNKEELDNLNRIVTMYLDYAEMQAKKLNIMTMHDWVERLDIFLKFNDKDILNNSGKITAEFAKKYAEEEYNKYVIEQDKLYISDFDVFLEENAEIYKI